MLRLFKSQTTDRYGKFDLRGLAPGEDKFLPGIKWQAFACEDEEFLKPCEDKASLMRGRRQGDHPSDDDCDQAGSQ
jgi:hypothetical protein